jgi:hypothetical protein
VGKIIGYIIFLLPFIKKALKKATLRVQRWKGARKLRITKKK